MEEYNISLEFEAYNKHIRTFKTVYLVAALHVTSKVPSVGSCR